MTEQKQNQKKQKVADNNTRKANGTLCQKIAPKGLFCGFVRYCATRTLLPLFALVVALASILIVSNSVQAASNSTLNFQARILQSSGSLVPDGDYNVEFKIYDNVSTGATAQGVCTGNCLWMETRTGVNAVRVVNGYVTANLGSVTPFGSTIPWDQDLYVTMRVGGTGSPSWDTEMVNLSTGRMKLSAVPYSFRAAVLMNAAGTSSFNADQLVQAGPSATQTVNTTGAAIALNQTGAGPLLDLQAGGLSKLTVDTSGNTVVLGSVDIRGSSLNLGTASVAGSIVLNDGSTNTTSLQAASTASDLVFTLPGGTGVNGDCLTTDGTGVLSFSSVCGGTLSVNPVANVQKTIDETQNNAVNPTATLQDDDELSFAIGANEAWSFRFTVQATNNATPDIKFAVTSPAGAVCKVGMSEAENALSNANIGCGISLGAVPTTTGTDMFEVYGTVVNGATAGNVTLQWAQNTANAAVTTVRAGSYLHADRISGPGQTAQAFIQNGNSFGATAVLGTNDSQALSVLTGGLERIRVLSTGNVGIGVATPASLFSVGTSSAFQVDASGNVSTAGTLTVGGQSLLQGNTIASGSATATTGTTSGVGGTNRTSITLAAAGTFANNDVIFVDNTGGSGQDYYTRIVSGGGTTTLTVSPAVGYGTAAGYTGNATITKYNVQNIGATTTDYTTQANRFFQGYFLGGVVVGAGSTTLSDGSLSRTNGNIEITPGSGGILKINGALDATTITGDGSALTNINGASISGSTITGLNASNISTGTLNDAQLSNNVALLNLSQTFSALKTFGAGASITAGQTFTVNGDAFTDLTGTGLQITSGSLNVAYGSTAGTSVEGSTTITISAGAGLSGGSTITLGSGGTSTLSVAYGSATNTAVQGNTTLTCASGTGNLSGGGNAITLGTGGTCGAITTNNAVAFSTSVTSPSFTGTAAVTLSSGGTSDLTLDSASNVLVISDATMRRVATGTTTLELNDSTNTTYAITNTNGAAVANLNVEGAITATSFSGSGASLTALSASNISTGTLNDAQLSSNVAVLNLSQSFTALKTFGAGAAVTTGQTFTVNGDAFTDLTGTGLQITAGSLNVVYGSTAGSAVQGNTSVSVSAGTGLTGGNTLTLGAGGTATLNVAYGSATNTAVQGNTTLTCPAGTGNLTGGGTAITLGTGGTCGAISTNNAVTFSTSVTTPSLTSTGALNVRSGGATALTIDTGAAATLTIAGTNANALGLGNSSGITTINGSTIVLGASIVRRVAAGTTNYEFNDTANTTLNIRNTDATAVANLSVEGGITAATVAGAGSGLTALNATNVTSGTLSDSQLSTNVALLTGTQSFSGNKTFNGGLVLGAASCSLGIASNNTLCFNGNSSGADITVGTNDAFRFGLETSGTLRITIDANGLVGIATGLTTLTSGFVVNTSFATATATTGVSSALSATQQAVFVSAASTTQTLPAATGVTGRIYTIKNTATGSATTIASSGGTINGATTYILSNANDSVEVQSDGTNWHIISGNNTYPLILVDARRTTAFTLGAVAVLPYNNAITNVGTAYNTTTGVFTAPAAGMYEISAAENVNLAAATSGDFYIEIYNVTGAASVQQVWNGDTNDTGGTAFRASTLVTRKITLTAGQQISIRTATNSGGAKTINTTNATANTLQITRLK